jgi:hypothetical protein
LPYIVTPIHPEMHAAISRDTWMPSVRLDHISPVHLKGQAKRRALQLPCLFQPTLSGKSIAGLGQSPALSCVTKMSYDPSVDGVHRRMGTTELLLCCAAAEMLSRVCNGYCLGFSSRLLWSRILAAVHPALCLLRRLPSQPFLPVHPISGGGGSSHVARVVSSCRRYPLASNGGQLQDIDFS